VDDARLELIRALLAEEKKRRLAPEAALQEFEDTLRTMAERAAAVSRTETPQYRTVVGGQVIESGDDLSVADKTARLLYLPIDEAEQAHLQEELTVWFDEHGYPGLLDLLISRRSVAAG
jgi:hypothetical protein